METIEYHAVDKSTWGDGPWQQEPDKRQWRDPATGYACLIVRGPTGALCGYVGVPRKHKAYGRKYDDVDVAAHGGLTFSRHCTDDPIEQGICHVPGEGEDDRVWWLGFDAAHAGDLSPGHEAVMNKIYADVGQERPTSAYIRDEVYRDLPYIEAEVTALAKRLATGDYTVTPRWRSAFRDMQMAWWTVRGLASPNEAFRRMSRLRLRLWASDLKRAVLKVRKPKP